MSDPSKQQLLRTLRQVGQIEPTAEATQRAMRRARSAVLSVTQSTQRQLFWRILMPTGIAATIIAVITLVSVFGTNSSANAAEALREIAAVNQAYKGWIHAKAESLPQPVDGGGRITGAMMHINTQKQIYTNVVDRGGDRTIEWLDRSDSEYQQYFSSRNELVSRDLPADLPMFQIQEQIKARKKLTPAELTGLLVTQPSMDSIMALVDYGCTISRRMEGDSERIDLALPKDQGAGDGAGAKPFLTALFDGKTRLLQRMTTSATENGDQLTVSYSYGDPEIRSIYDLGVPKTTPVVSQRTKVAPGVNTLLDRLDGHVGEHENLGEYVAIHTQAWLMEGNAPLRMHLAIYGHSGNKWFYGRYDKLKDRKLNLEGWPTPGMSAVRGALTEKPDDFFLTDGRQSWNGLPNGGINLRRTRSPLVYAEAYMLSGLIWPGRWRTSDNSSYEVQDASDAQYPGLKLLTSDSGGALGRVEEQWHFDPTRDDVPVSSSRTLFFRKGGAVGEGTQTRYLDYAQLPGGQWYPTRWVDTVTVYDAKVPTKKSFVVTCEHRLQILPDQRLDAQWFTDPTKRPAKP